MLRLGGWVGKTHPVVAVKARDSHLTNEAEIQGYEEVFWARAFCFCAAASSSSTG